jgi:nitrite reductase (NO-forming)
MTSLTITFKYLQIVSISGLLFNDKLSLDNHAALLNAMSSFAPVSPGQKPSYAFIATQPGFFKYYCEGIAVHAMDQHVFSGMVGGVIVDPANGYTGYTGNNRLG